LNHQSQRPTFFLVKRSLKNRNIDTLDPLTVHSPQVSNIQKQTQSISLIFKVKVNFFFINTCYSFLLMLLIIFGLFFFFFFFFFFFCFFFFFFFFFLFFFFFFFFLKKKKKKKLFKVTFLYCIFYFILFCAHISVSFFKCFLFNDN